MIGWPPVEPTRSQQRAWIRRQTPNMKCQFSCTWMFLLEKLAYRKHQQKMHLQLASALSYSHLKNLYRPTQEMSLLFLFETVATCCNKTTVANATVTAGLQRLHCWSSGTCFKPWESQRFKWKSSFVSSDRGEMAFFPKASPTSPNFTDQNHSSECSRADQRPGAGAVASRRRCRGLKLCFLRVN